MWTIEAWLVMIQSLAWESLKDPIWNIYSIYLNQEYGSENLGPYTENECRLIGIENPPVINKIATSF